MIKISIDGITEFYENGIINLKKLIAKKSGKKYS